MTSNWTFSSPLIHCNIPSNRTNIVNCGKRLDSPKPKHTDATTFRRSANYAPSLWSYEYVQSLTSKYAGEKYTARLQTLKEAVRIMIYKDSEKIENTLNILNLIDDLQRLGISYHFLNEISDVLEKIYNNYYKSDKTWAKMDVNLKSIGFRLLRQHGHHIPQEIFEDLKDETGCFKHEDIVGMLNLYEASYMSIEGESILDDARDFTTKHLKESLHNNNILDQNISLLVSHALDFPLRWRVPRMEAEWFIHVYERRSAANTELVELSKLDFNRVQAIHQEDLKYASRWWKVTCWENFGFARDRLVENFIWSVGENYMPHFPGRSTLTKVNAMITTIDDVYDVYGTLHELEQFTDIVSSWDISAIEELPDYMKICFFGFHNTINQISYDALTNKGFFILPYLKKAWQDLCKSFLIEARWYHNRYTPSLNEYIDNSYMSSGAGVIIMHAYFLTLTSVTEEALECIERAENIFRAASLIFRFNNDLATSSDELERGDAPKCIECYMHESGATEVEARTYIKELIVETWKKLNMECLEIGSSFPQEFIECIINIGRMGHFAYTNGDKHSYPDMMKSHVLSLLVNQIE